MSLSIAQITFDCRNAEALAEFWSKLLDRPVDPGANPFFASIGRQDGPSEHPGLMFIQVPESKQVKNRVHLDLHLNREGADGSAELERAIGLGAVSVSEHQEYGLHWVTLQDPEGNEFDLAVSR
jgi:hypothetical protein